MRSARTARHVRDLLGGRNDTSELRTVLDKIVVLAERHGVKVIGLRSPLSAEYRRHAQSYDIGSVLAAYDHAPLHAMLDYARYLSDRTDYFQDGDHLNDLGAAVFTRRVARDLRGIAPDAAVAASIGRTAPAPRPPALFWPYNDVISPWLRELACTRWEPGCEPAPSVPTQVAAAQPGAFDGPGNGGQSVMQQADTYLWAGVLLLGLVLAWWTIAQAPRQPGSFAARPRRMAELNLAISANRIEAARGIIAAQLALLRRQRPEEPPEFAVLRSCPASTIELFRRLTSQSHIIFDSRDARAASDAWTLHDLGLAVVKQRLPTEIEIGLSSTAMELLDRQRERALKEWSARNAQERVAAMEHPAG